jgi:hypothetical protein
MALRRVAYPSPNYSSRGGAKVRLIVLHTAEGATTIESLGAFFANPASGVSSHTGIDDTPNTVGEYVRRDGKAWTAADANPYSVQTELCGFAAWDNATWQTHGAMLANCAAWIAEEAAHFKIPIVGLTAAQAQSGTAGVCQHNDLGAMGGGHWDCGPGFPMAQVLDMARGGAPPSTTSPEVPDMIAAPCVFTTADDVQQVFYIDGHGQLAHHYAGRDGRWAGETLGGGWDTDTDLTFAVAANGAQQVWGVRADGRRAQCYWSGRQWVTQLL